MTFDVTRVLSLHSNQIEAAWKHARLKHTEEESSCKQASIALHQALHDGNESKSEHIDGQPDVRFELLQQDIARDLKQTVWDEEDRKCDVISVPDQTQIVNQAVHGCVADVNAIQEGQN
jgi:hypothetical protein